MLVEVDSPLPLERACSSCHSTKPAEAFSGFATCDDCRTKKRKRWGNKQAHMRRQRTDLSSDLNDPLHKHGESSDSPNSDRDYEAEIASLLKQLDNETRSNTKKQAENDFLQSVVKASDVQRSKLGRMIQTQAQEIVMLRADALLAMRWKAGCRCPASANCYSIRDSQQLPEQMVYSQYVAGQVPTPESFQQMPGQMPNYQPQDMMTGKMTGQHTAMQPNTQTTQFHVATNSHNPSRSQIIKPECLIGGACHHPDALVDYSFAQIMNDDSSGSFEQLSGSLTGSGQGTGRVCDQAEGTGQTCDQAEGTGQTCDQADSDYSDDTLPCDKSNSDLPNDALLCNDPADTATALTTGNYTKSLNYGIWFEDAEMEEAFQDQMSRQRRFAMCALWPALCISATVGDMAIQVLYPDDYQYFLTTTQLGVYAALMGGLCVFYRMCIWCTEIQPHHVKRVKLFGELWFYVGACRNLVFIVSKCYGDVEPAAEDWILLSLTVCMRAVFFSWSELSPIGACTSTVPIWVALLMVPHVSFVFRMRVSFLAVFMGVLSFLIYQNNRETFVDQVRLKHAHSVTAELKVEAEVKQEQESKYKRLHVGDFDYYFKPRVIIPESPERAC